MPVTLLAVVPLVAITAISVFPLTGVVPKVTPIDADKAKVAATAAQ